MGIKGINTNSSPQDHGLPDLGQSYWNPLWEIRSDLQTLLPLGRSPLSPERVWFPQMSVDVDHLDSCQRLAAQTG